MSYSIYFSKTTSDDYTEEEYQDRITNDVWFTRGANRPLFNYKYYVGMPGFNLNMVESDFWYNGEGSTGGTKGVLWGILSDYQLTGLPGVNPKLFSKLGFPSSFYTFSQMCVLLTAFVESESPPTTLVDDEQSQRWNLQNGGIYEDPIMPLIENKDLACYIPAVDQYFKIRFSIWSGGYSPSNPLSIAYYRTPLFSVSNICFPEDTLISIDQGIIPIQHIDIEKHTIKNKKIVAITRSVLDDDYLVRFDNHSLMKNNPTNVTIMSPDHKIMWKNKLEPAKNFIKKFPGVTKIPYKKEILYNILLDTYEKVLVNNLVCETLHPSNPIAEKYRK
jgi:hypothetical protein